MRAKKNNMKKRFYCLIMSFVQAIENRMRIENSKKLKQNKTDYKQWN